MVKHAVVANKLSKKFAKGTKNQMTYGLLDSLSTSIGIKSNFDQLRENEFWALNNISFKVEEGSSLGIIGSNGSGKSTLLKMLAGIYLPDKGSITIKGQVGALIELGAGFHTELTGRENVYLNATMLGFKKKQIDKIYHDIVEFSELEDFIEVPIKNYSSGMQARLGFSVIAHVKPEVLLVDEVLSVGDIHFHHKSWEKIKQLHEDKTTLVLVAHNLMAVQTLCEDTIWIEKGKVITRGKTADVIAQYYDYANKKALEADDIADSQVRKGGGQIRITKVNFLNKHHKPINQVVCGQPLIVRAHYQKHKKLLNDKKTVFTVIIAMPTSSYALTIARSTDHKISKLGTTGYIDFYFPYMILSPKTYIVNISITHEDGHRYFYDYWARAGGSFEIVHSELTKSLGLVVDTGVKLPYQTEVKINTSG